jgi:DNA repair ATPase RecN
VTGRARTLHAWQVQSKNELTPISADFRQSNNELTPISESLRPLIDPADLTPEAIEEFERKQRELQAAIDAGHIKIGGNAKNA